MYEELIHRLEQATESDRELDCDIAVAVLGGEIEWKQANYSMEMSPVRRYASTMHVGGRGGDPVERYTGSMDAALSLVPKGFDYGFSYSKKDGLETWVQRPFHEGPCYQGDAPEGIADDRTRALAICIAALKARS